ncbi:hemicentin-1-like isoform X3 [Dysidea avara]|uniref:hemicentin-1-like isoform X3 n=1 Tax=Dysidea avara TaxID=196820 RepID=UPI0033193062
MKLCTLLLTVLHFANGQFFTGAINNMVLPLNGSSINVTCPVSGSFDSTEWFMYSTTGSSVVSVSTGMDLVVTDAGSYYCEVTEQRGVYRSNTFTVYAVGFADNFSVNPKNLTVFVNSPRIAFECQINTFAETEDDFNLMRIEWESTNSSAPNDFTTITQGMILNPLPGYSVLIIDTMDVTSELDVYRCQAVFMLSNRTNITMATSDSAYLNLDDDPMGSSTVPMENRTFLLSPTDEVVTEMDTTAFVCVPVNSTLMPSWSPSDGVMLGMSNTYLLVLNVTSDNVVSCTIDGDTVNVTLTVQEVPVLQGPLVLPEVTLVQTGNDVTLECPQMITYPIPSLMWLANGSVVLENMVNYTFTTVGDTTEGIYQCLVEASFTPTTNRAGLPPVISFVTTTFVDVFCVPNVMISVSGATGDDTDGDHDVMSGTSFSLTCELSCPTTVLTWTQNGAEISNSSYNTVTVDGFSVNYTTDAGYFSQSVLTKDMAAPTDTATYQCTTTVQSMTASAEATVVVYVAPIITQGPTDVSAMIDGSVVFTCTATGIPLPTITWMDENIILMGSDMIINGTTIQSTLTLSNLQDDDFDNYTCTATNMFGSDDVTALLGISAEITQGPMDMARMINDNVTFTCTATGIPLPIITWSSDSRNSIEATGDIVIDVNRTVSILTLSNLQDDDFDNYTCTATNMFGSDDVTVLLGRDAMITVGPVNTSAMIGGGETLTCTATGIPLPNITWMNQDGNTAGTPSDMMINPTTILSTLTFSNLQDNDFGNYVCMASNTFNNDTATALLGRDAMIIVGPIDTPATIGGGENLTCTATGIPLPNITWMNQDGNTAGTPSDMMIDATTIQSTLTFSNLQDDDFGNYVCMASNTFNIDTATALLGISANIIQGPLEVTSLIGGSVMFTCTATGIPLPTISWSSDTGGDITTIAQTMSNMTTIYSEIIISDIQMDNFTNYTCTAENQFASVTAVAMLVNATIPIITIPPEDSTVLFGGDVTFTCRAIGIPAPIITWSSDSNDNIPTTSNIAESEESTRSTLTLNNLMLSDFNQSYTCNASNEHGTTSRSALLIQGMAAVITKSPVDTSAMINDNVIFTCTATGIPLPVVTWMDENDNSGLMGSDMIIDSITIQSTLMLSILQDGDFNNYTCTATNMFGSDNVTVLLGLVPVITQSPIDTPGVLGGSVVFTCTATGIPLPNITWMDENNILMGSDMIINGTTILSTLTSSNLQDDDFDNYTCTATNMFGSDDVTALLGMTALITQGPINTPRVLGGSVVFTCTATGIPLPNITWMDENIILMGSDMIINDTTIQSTLTLSNLQDDDFDNYTCTATNMFGSDDVTALLGMVPNITQSPVDMARMINDNVTFTCTVTGIPLPIITWMDQDSNIVGTTSDIIINGDTVRLSTLTLSNLQDDDFDNYTCTATNMFGSDDVTALLGISAEITQGPMDMARMINDNVTFTCTVTGIPLPIITWSSDSRNSIEATGDIVIDANRTVSMLMLSNLQDDDFDNYTCTAINMFGSDDVTALLGMVAVITQGPVDTSAMLSGSVMFTCTATGIPLPTITWMDQDGNIVGTAMVIDGDTVRKSKLTLSNLQHEDFDNYTCTATNLFGSDDATVLLEMVPAITQGPIDTPGVLGGSVMFTCIAAGIPLPTITWMDENIILMGSYMIINGTTIQSTLTLSNLQAEDFDNYTCTATNMFGSDDVTALLGMVPNVTENPIDIARMINNNATFTCTATGIPLPTITWTDQDGNTVGITSDMIINGTTIQSTLTLSNLQDDDFDNYTCTVTNIFGSDDVSALLGMVPVIRRGPMSTSGMIGGGAMFTCTATGIPLPSITWMDENDNIVGIASDMMIDDTTLQSVLALSNLQDDGFDNYTCTATNMFGSDNVTALLEMPLNVTIQSVDETSIQLRWIDPMLVSEMTVYYQVYYTPAGQGSTLSTNSTTTSIALSDLVPGVEYSINVTAVTTTGGRITSTTVTAITLTTALFQIRIRPISNCSEWVDDRQRQKFDDIISQLMDEITSRCSCTFNIINETFSCRGSIGNFVDTVVFRARVSLQDSVITADDVVDDITNWVQSSPSISVAAVTLDVDPSCPAMLDSFNSADCVVVTTSSSSSLPIGIIIGGATVGVVVVILIIIIIEALIVVYCTRKHCSSSIKSINRQPENDYDDNRQPEDIYDDNRLPESNYDDVGSVYEAIHPIAPDHQPVTMEKNPACQSMVLANKANIDPDENEYEITSFQPASSNNMQNGPTYAETQFK